MCPVYWDSLNSFTAQDIFPSQRATKLCLLIEILQIDRPAFCNSTKTCGFGQYIPLWHSCGIQAELFQKNIAVKTVVECLLWL